MLVSEIITLARALTPQVDSSSYNDATGLIDFNIVYKQLLGEIKQDVNEDQFSDFFTADLVAGQSEYSIPVINGNNPGMDQLLGVSICYDVPVSGTGTVAISNATQIVTGTNTLFTTQTKPGNALIISGSKYIIVSITNDTSLVIDRIPDSSLSGQSYTISNENFMKARPSRYSNLDRDESYYRLNQPQSDPFFIKYDTGIFIYPVPISAVPMGLILHGTYDLTTLGLSDTPLLENAWHYVLALGMRPFILKRKGLINEKNDADGEYQREIRRTLTNISETYKSPVTRESPSLTQFQ